MENKAINDAAELVKSIKDQYESTNPEQFAAADEGLNILNACDALTIASKQLSDTAAILKNYLERNSVSEELSPEIKGFSAYLQEEIKSINTDTQEALSGINTFLKDSKGRVTTAAGNLPKLLKLDKLINKIKAKIQGIGKKSSAIFDKIDKFENNTVDKINKITDTKNYLFGYKHLQVEPTKELGFCQAIKGCLTKISDICSSGSKKAAPALSPKELLIKKMKDEAENLHKQLITLPPEEIIDHSFEKVFKDEFIICAESMNQNDDFSEAAVKALYAEAYPLDYIYSEWMSSDLDHSFDDFVESIKNSANKLIRLNNDRYIDRDADGIPDVIDDSPEINYEKDDIEDQYFYTQLSEADIKELEEAGVNVEVGTKTGDNINVRLLLTEKEKAETVLNEPPMKL